MIKVNCLHKTKNGSSIFIKQDTYIGIHGEVTYNQGIYGEVLHNERKIRIIYNNEGKAITWRYIDNSLNISKYAINEKLTSGFDLVTNTYEDAVEIIESL